MSRLFLSLMVLGLVSVVCLERAEAQGVFHNGDGPGYNRVFGGSIRGRHYYGVPRYRARRYYGSRYGGGFSYGYYYQPRTYVPYSYPFYGWCFPPPSAYYGRGCR